MDSNYNNNPDSLITITTTLTTATTTTAATNTSPMLQHIKKKSVPTESNPYSSSSSTKTSPRKLLHTKEQRRISQAKSIDIECVTDDDGDERGSLLAQKTNYLSFDSDTLKHRPTSLRFNNENSSSNHHHHHQPIYDSDKLIANQENLTQNFETKCLSNPILNNQKKKLIHFKANNNNDSNTIENNNTNNSNNLQASEKISFSSNNSQLPRNASGKHF